jgi:Protein of unknown function (DUF2817)
VLDSHFHRSYAAARQHFLALCERTSARVDSNEHPVRGPDGAIYTDIASWHDDDEGPLVVISSGTHGIEGYAGSGIQCALLAEGLHRAYATPVMMVHAINPYGFAWQRRVNEDNVDLNRNSVDFSKTLPSSTAYDELAKLLEPDAWTEASIATITSGLGKFVSVHGFPALQAALTAGQYGHPNGFFYGGRAPAWSTKNIQTLAASRWSRRRAVIMIDIHTGLGEFGTGECIVEHAAGSAAFNRSRAMWGDRVRSTIDGDAASVDISGSMISGLGRSLGERFLGTGLEFGTVAPMEVLMALVADQYLHRYGSIDSPQGREIKGKMMRAFYPDSDEWRTSVTDIAREVVSKALELSA